MKVIGITGGVGSGKSALLSYIAEKYSCRIILADEAANRLKQPGEPCYEPLVKVLGTDVLNEDGTINKDKMAERIFHNPDLLARINQIIHPAVKQYILQEIEKEKNDKRVPFFFIEAALLIEDGYLHIVDEMWYIYAEETVRKQRVKETRNYSDEKTEAIIRSQCTDGNFRKACRVVIDNSGSLEEAYRQIDQNLEGVG